MSSLFSGRHAHSVRPGPYGRRAGFSLTETLMQMMILTTVTIPMLMLVNIQSNQIEDLRQTTENQVLVRQLFDNVMLPHPDPVDTYTVSSNTSIYCDPQTKVKSESDYTSTCTSGGPDEDKPPFFRRSVSYTSTKYDAVKVTVELYETSASGTPYFTLAREYQLDSYRVNMGEVATDLKSVAQPASDNFGTQVDTDIMGNLWQPEYVDTLTAPSSGGNNAYYNGGCASGYAAAGPLSGLKAPYNMYRDMDSGGCSTGVSYIFKVMPGVTYDVNLHFVLPSSPATNCLTDTHNVSCALADIEIFSRDSTYSGTYPKLREYNNFDISAAASIGQTLQGVTLQTPVTTLNNTAELEIKVKPTTGASTTHVYLAGIEVLRRPDQ